jgi:hypothetical protein
MLSSFPSHAQGHRLKRMYKLPLRSRGSIQLIGSQSLDSGENMHHFLRDKRETFALITRLLGVRDISLIKLGMSPILIGTLRYTPYQTEVNDKVRKKQVTKLMCPARRHYFHSQPNQVQVNGWQVKEWQNMWISPQHNIAALGFEDTTKPVGGRHSINQFYANV